MSKKITLCFFATLIINQHEINTASDQVPSVETTDFRMAVRAGYRETCLAMLNQPKTVARIDFNAVSSETKYTLWDEIIQNGFLEDIALKILELRTENNELVVDINCQQLNSKRTKLQQAIVYFQPRLILQILGLKKSNGALLVDINLTDCANFSALQDMIIAWHRDTIRGNQATIKDRKSWYALIIKRLLLLGADTTNMPINYGFPDCINPILPLLTHCTTQPHEWILPIFDALKPDLDLKNLTMEESMVVQAYQEFLQGKHDELRNQLLILPDALKQKGLYKDPLVCRLDLIFKPESIKPLLIFLAEKRYQRKIADEVHKYIC